MLVATQKTPGPKKSKALAEEENEAAREFLRTVVNRDFAGNLTVAAKKFGVTQPYLSKLLSEKGGFGMKILRPLAEHAGVPLDVVLGRMAFTVPTAQTVVEMTDRYDNRVRAVRAARELGYPEQAIEVVQSIALESDADPEPGEWLRWIEAEARKLKFARKDPAAAQREREVSAVDVAALSEESRLRKAEAKRQIEERDRAEAEERKRAGGKG